MSHLNPPDNYSDGYVEYQEDQIFEKIKEYPSYHFLDYLFKKELLWTYDQQHYFLLHEIWGDGPADRMRVCSACVKFGASFNTWIDFAEWKKQVVHIDWLCTMSEWRGIGTLQVLSKILQEAAEETGVFLFGHARPFQITLPQLTDQKAVEDWISRPEEEKKFVGLKKEKEAAKKLYQKYREYGFCNFDGIGIDFNNRWWRNTCFGYRSTKMEKSVVSDFLDLHLKC